MSLDFDSVSFTHPGAASPLFTRVSLHCRAGWTGIVGANGAGKTTLLRLAMGELQPDEGSVRRCGPVACCAQRTDRTSPEMADFLASCEGSACRLRGVFGTGDDWGSRWSTLSHGERNRAQIAFALWTSPEVLLLDEPTNHIDERGRLHLLEGLRLFRGTGVLVSHDRELLDSLCYQCAFVDPPALIVRPGNYSAAFQAHQHEERGRQAEIDRMAREVSRLRREADRRSRAAARADKRRSKRGLGKGDSDGRERIDRARMSGADGRPGALARQLDGRLRQAERRLNGLEIRKRYDLHFRLPGIPSPRSRVLFEPAGILPLPDGRKIHLPPLSIMQDDRIAVVGPNGAGKSTVVRHLLSRLDVEKGKIVYLPQEVDLERSRSLVRQLHVLPEAVQGQVLTIVSALGSRPPRLLASDEPSPGEARKLLLALGAVHEPFLVVMDEPTNHLDLPAIECLEDALAGCRAALLLVSHDRRFLQRLTRVQWVLQPTTDGSRLEIAL